MIGKTNTFKHFYRVSDLGPIKVLHILSFSFKLTTFVTFFGRLISNGGFLLSRVNVLHIVGTLVSCANVQMSFLASGSKCGLVNRAILQIN